MIELFLIFAYIGLFTIGGALVAIPLIEEQVITRGWITLETFIQMVAISEATPGPVGINIATYVGLVRYHIPGAILATFGFVVPSFIIVLIFARLYTKHKESKWLKIVFDVLKAGIIGLIAVTFFNISKSTLWVASTQQPDWLSLVLAMLLGGFYFTLKKHPIYMILLAAVLGILIY